MKSANGDSCVQELSDMKESIFSTDVCMDKLENQLRIVVDVIRVELPEVKKVTSIRTICMRCHGTATRIFYLRCICYFNCTSHSP